MRFKSPEEHGYLLMERAISCLEQLQERSRSAPPLMRVELERIERDMRRLWDKMPWSNIAWPR
jgi:hypothetical protein